MCVLTNIFVSVTVVLFQIYCVIILNTLLMLFDISTENLYCAVVYILCEIYNEIILKNQQRLRWQ